MGFISSKLLTRENKLKCMPFFLLGRGNTGEEFKSIIWVAGLALFKVALSDLIICTTQLKYVTWGNIS